jgi:hypothetical protein
MPRLAHPDLPGQVIDVVSDSHAAVLAKSGWVPEDGTPTPSLADVLDGHTDSLDLSDEGDPTDPAPAGDTPEE